MGLFDIFSTKDQTAAANDQIKGLNAGFSQASPLLQQGAGALQTNYSAGLQPFLQNFATGNAGQGAYADATGANGQAGFDRATTNFRADPGYQFSVDQGIGNIDRNKAATGQLASGGTNADVGRFVSGLADQQYGNYVSRLAPFLGTSSAAASGIGTLNAGLGSALNSNLGTQANLAYGTQSGIGNANASADLAGLTASGNLWGAIMQGAKLAASAATGLPLGGGGGSAPTANAGNAASGFQPFISY